MPRAAIDIGSNSLLLLVVDDNGTLLHDQVAVVGLGKGLGDRGLFQPDRMALAEATLSEFAHKAATFGIPAGRIRAVATSAARRALNAETWFARVKRSTSISVSIISGDEEARLTWLGALRDLPPCEAPLLVVDLGGGSTELALGDS
jgi:exopolyphosphatase/guanosine-5'-triphosphate,3'-diphosphate pyrophosphatase